MRQGLHTLASVLLILCLPSCTRPQPDTPAVDRTAEAKAFVAQLAAGDYATAAQGFDATMTRVMPAAKLQEAWEELVAGAGALGEQLGTRTLHDKGYDIVFVTCKFAQGLVDVRVVYDAQGKVSGLWFGPADRSGEYQAPAYVDAKAFDEREVTVGEGEWALPATLAMPHGVDKAPAVILVHGSGPQDRDETIGPSKPFRDLAGGLASQGIAVLRYEKRTKQYAGKLAKAQAGLTVKEETIDDAVAAVALLRQTPGVDPARVFVLGHSLGGSVAPRIGQADPQIAGLIILAGTTRPLEEVGIEQLDYIASLPGHESEAEQQQIAKLKAELERVKASNLTTDLRPDEILFGAPPSYWLDLRANPPAATAAKLTIPMLILQGGRDYQVTTVDLDGWRQALGSRANVQLKLYENLNHLFAEGQGKATPEEYAKPAHVSQQVIEDIAGWIVSLPATQPGP